MVTKVKIYPGICKFTTVAQVEKQPTGELKIDIFSACPNLTAFKDAVKSVKMMEAINLPKANAILKAGQTIPHSCCPIPVGVIKACEVEIKFALKSEVKIEFMDSAAKPEGETEESQAEESEE
jgi:hypothetical protein